MARVQLQRLAAECNRVAAVQNVDALRESHATGREPPHDADAASVYSQGFFLAVLIDVEVSDARTFRQASKRSRFLGRHSVRDCLCWEQKKTVLPTYHVDGQPVFALAAGPLQLARPEVPPVHDVQDPAAKGRDKNLGSDLGGERREERAVGLGRERVPDVEAGERARGRMSLGGLGMSMGERSRSLSSHGSGL